MTITAHDVDRMMDFATFIYVHNNRNSDIDEATKFAHEMFKEFCVVEGITSVCTDEDKYCAFCDLCEYNDECKDRDNISKV